jgi:hypothetical protein
MDDPTKHVQNFVSFAAKHLKLTKMPHIRFVGHEEDEKQTFGHSVGNEVVVRTAGRHPIDVMRTLAHELTHFKQGKSKKSEDQREDGANAMAGRVMRAYDTKYPKSFKVAPISEDEGGVAANSIAGGGIEMYSPLLKIKQGKKLKDILKRHAPTN